jgi:DNA-binding response OmpR family regulator
MFYRESDQQQDQIARGGNALRNLILLVEDDQSTASLLIQIITQETTYQVAHASDGRTAWKFLQQVKPQLVILDSLLKETVRFRRTIRDASCTYTLPA